MRACCRARSATVALSCISRASCRASCRPCPMPPDGDGMGDMCDGAVRELRPTEPSSGVHCGGRARPLVGLQLELSDDLAELHEYSSSPSEWWRLSLRVSLQYCSLLVTGGNDVVDRLRVWPKVSTPREDFLGREKTPRACVLAAGLPQITLSSEPSSESPLPRLDLPGTSRSPPDSSLAGTAAGRLTLSARSSGTDSCGGRPPGEGAAASPRAP
mmetsp:Transcript_28101/g.66912  ORF Transcript_28101/g.66912 Transcript_28101/m.66912 type:complete len:215 (+) Transcript_28101:268-912(+)